MAFLGYFLRRLSLVIPTFLGVTIITFTLTYVLPGNPAVVKAGPLVSPEVVKELEKAMGLDQPAWVQYGRYISGVLHGDLGQSASTGRPVLEDFKQRLPATLELTLASLLIALALGIPLGVQSAVHRDTAIDHLGRIVGVAGVAMPTFWTGLLSLYVFFYLLGIAAAAARPPRRRHRAAAGHHRPLCAGQPAHRQLDDAGLRAAPAHVLPALTLGLSVMAPIARMVRSTMLEILESDYIKAAWAAGIPPRRVIYGDALANALIPLITILGIVFGFLMAGNAVVESVFAWPGIGNYAITSLMTKDSGPIESFVLFVALLYVVVNFVIDILYGLIDPRIRLE